MATHRRGTRRELRADLVFQIARTLRNARTVLDPDAATALQALVDGTLQRAFGEPSPLTDPRYADPSGLGRYRAAMHRMELLIRAAVRTARQRRAVPVVVGTADLEAGLAAVAREIDTWPLPKTTSWGMIR